MKATRNVYLLITILILIPIFTKYIKNIVNARRLRNRDIVNKQLIYLIVTSIIICALTMSLYKFTVSNQAPLVAERVGETFANSIKDKDSQADFQKLLYEKKLATDVDIIGYDQDLDLIDFSDDYIMDLSERTYTDGDDGIIYCRYMQDDSLVYIGMSLSPDDYRWKLSILTVLEEEDIEKVDPKMRFISIN